jgi:hypothetical protein
MSHMFSGILRFVATFFSLVLLSTFTAANTCNSFANYLCAQSTPNTLHIIGQRPTGLSVGTTGGLIIGNSFGVQMAGNGSATDIVIIAAFAGSLGGTLNGQSFMTLGSFPEGGALGAISSTLQAINLGTSPISFGYVDLQTGLSSNGTLQVSANGLPRGTAIYGLALNPVTTCVHEKRGSETCTTTNFITNITPNSEAGVTRTVMPEPGTWTLLSTALITLAGVARRRLVA